MRERRVQDLACPSFLPSLKRRNAKWSPNTIPANATPTRDHNGNLHVLSASASAAETPPASGRRHPRDRLPAAHPAGETRLASTQVDRVSGNLGRERFVAWKCRQKLWNPRAPSQAGEHNIPFHEGRHPIATKAQKKSASATPETSPSAGGGPAATAAAAAATDAAFGGGGATERRPDDTSYRNDDCKFSNHAE